MTRLVAGALLQWLAARGVVGGALPPILVDPVDLRPTACGGACNGDKSTLYSNFAQKWRGGGGITAKGA